MSDTSTIAPAWVVLPVAGIALIVLAGHMQAMWEAARRGAVPASRVRIRTVNGFVMMVTACLAAYGFGIVTPSEAGMFVLAWSAVAGLIGIVVMLAVVDAMNTARLSWRVRREAREILRDRVARELAEARAQRPGADRLRLRHDDAGEG